MPLRAESCVDRAGPAGSPSHGCLGDDSIICRIIQQSSFTNYICSLPSTNVRFGSSAALQDSTTSTAAIGGQAAVPLRFFKNQYLNVCYSQKRTFKPHQNREFDRPLTANSGRSDWSKMGGKCSALLGRLLNVPYHRWKHHTGGASRRQSQLRTVHLGRIPHSNPNTSERLFALVY